MKDELEVALIQPDLVWENAVQNRKLLTNKIDPLAEVDLIVLPEMFSTGFTMNPEPVAEKMDGVTIKWMLDLAKRKNAAIMGSLVIQENSCFFNRLIFVSPEGEIQYYDKRHTFTLAGEDKVYTAGKSHTIFSYKGWKICPLICYDLRFPVWSRNTTSYDVLIYVANWPKPRIIAWDTLLAARAIENMCYCIGVNRVGEDANGNEYNGHSGVYDSLGTQLITNEGKEITQTITLHKRTLNEARARFNFLADQDDFSLKI